MKPPKKSGVITFEKVDGIIETVETWSSLSIKNLKSHQKLSKFSEDEIIYSLIKSKFHRWQEDEIPAGDLMHNICGYYDNAKLISLDYISFTFQEFQRKLSEIIIKANGDSELLFRNRIQEVIGKLNHKSCFYYLNPTEDKKTEFNPYSIFLGCISINRENNIVTLIEFSQD